MPLGAEGLLVVPYLAGERTPVFDPEARGLIAGLTLRHGRGHLFRACYEGIAFGIRQILDLFDESETPAEAHRGRRRWAPGAAVDHHRQRHHRTDPARPEQTIGACYGGALLAAIGTRQVPPETDWTVLAREVVPDPDRRAAYDQLYPIWRELYPATRDQMHRLGALAKH